MIWTFLTYIFVIIFVLFFFGFCIFIHEVGHFLAAKWRKMHIVAFSIGFKKIWCYKHKGIEYRIGCLPFGGYVDIPQLETSDNVKDSEGNKLPSIKPTDRIIVAFAGPLFNILFGFVLATFLWIYGIPQSTPRMDSIIVAEVTANSPEYRAGLRKGDDIVQINGESFDTNWNGVIQKILFSVGDVTLGIKTDNKIKTIAYAPAVNPNNKLMAEEGLPYPFFRPEIPFIIQVVPGSNASSEGLKTDDRIIKINNSYIIDYENYINAINDGNGKPVSIEIVRDNHPLTLNIKPTVVEEGKRHLIGVFPNTEVNDKLQIKKIVPNSAAAEHGIKIGDVILEADGNIISSITDLVNIINTNHGSPMSLLVQRGNEKLNFEITPKLHIPYQIAGISVVFFNHVNPWQQFINVINMSYKSLRGIFTSGSRIKAKHMSGPIGIVTVIGKAVYNGSIVHALNIIAIITFSLAILNLLPLPILDGGHILISVIELIIRRPIPNKLLQPICMFFIIVLISLMIFVTFNDVDRITKFTRIFKSKQITQPQQIEIDTSKQ